jgi:hypothetical protein
MAKLIEYKNGLPVFSIHNETDGKLIALAIRIMVDIEMKAEVAKVKLDSVPWLFDRSTGFWYRLSGEYGNLIITYTDAENPNDPKSYELGYFESFPLSGPYCYTFAQAFDAFKHSLMSYYSTNAAAWYFRYWRVKKGNLVFKPQRRGQKPKVEFEENEKGKIQFAEMNSRCMLLIPIITFLTAPRRQNKLFLPYSFFL